MSQAPSHEQQLMMLRDMTNMTGIMHEAQILQLKTWPRVLIPESKGAEVVIDSDAWRIAYKVQAPVNTQVAPDLLQALVRSVRWLLGDGWDVSLALNGQSLLEDTGDASCRTRLRKPEEKSPQTLVIPDPS